MWTPIDFGKHAGKSLPQIVFSDPDWFFWAYGNRAFSGWYKSAEEAERVYRRATSIRPPLDRDRQPYGVEYLRERSTGHFAGLQLVLAVSGDAIYDRIDMSAPRRLKEYDKRGYEIFLKDLKDILFGDRRVRMTRRRCEEFFDDPGNFLTP